MREGDVYCCEECGLELEVLAECSHDDTDEDDDRHDLAGGPARRLGSDRLDNHGRYSTLLTSHRWRSSLQVT